MIKQTIQADQIAAMKAHDTDKLQTLRYILAQIKNKEIEKREDLTNEEAVDVLRKENKKLQEAAEAFKQGGREDLAAENAKQAEIIAAYLPKELSDDELKAKVQEIIAQNEEMFKKNPNAMIGMCIGRLKSEAESSRIAAVVKSLQ
ncbi:GatB/YqeY domain-containing protein [Candidatus Roizmanbacteria bacterium]|nr:MAG: GatB/YqeY domain-containing protein [Candidatus Roizmanbacteria bacterium]